jgi:hypothetical protein
MDSIYQIKNYILTKENTNILKDIISNAQLDNPIVMQENAFECAIMAMKKDWPNSIVRSLIANILNLDYVNDKNRNLVYYATKYNRFSILKDLDLFGKESLQWFPPNDQNSLGTLGINVNISDNNGKTPLMVALENENFKITKWLLKKGASIDVADKMGMYPMHYATKYCDELIIIKLIYEKSQYYEHIFTNISPLIVAVIEKNKLMVSYLVSLFPQYIINNIDSAGMTALHWATNEDQPKLKIIQKLVESGIDKEIKDHRNMTALDYAYLHDTNEAIKKVFEK